MAREHTANFRCGHDGCAQYVHYTYVTQREYREIYGEQKRHPWKCNRHRDPQLNLRPGNESTQHVLTATRVHDSEGGWLDGLYWRAEGAGAGSGFTYGPGFNAYASDFPEGTRLIVATQIKMPEGTS